MEDINKKCSFKEHKEINAISFCHDCNIFICNKCLKYHQGLFEQHHITNLEKNKDLFIDICKEKKHRNKLEFYCKKHNQLCCAACITKIETKGYGQHKNCDICAIEDIKEEKKNKLKDNIKYLEDLSEDLNDSIKELKTIFDKIEERKEELKLKIQNIFTKIRTALNEREDELLLEVDNKYNDIFGKEDIIKESEKLPNKIKLSLEKGKLIDKDWNDNNKLSSIINNCINIEDNIKIISLINDNIKKYKMNEEINIAFDTEEEYYNNFIKNIKSLGNFYDLSNIDSLILKNKEDLIKFDNLISTKIKIFNIKLLYRSSRDGLTLNILKDKINNKSKLIFLFLSGNTRIFGSFIKATIKIEIDLDNYIKDKDAFAFSLNNNKIYEILIPDLAIRFQKDYLLLIGNNACGNGFWIGKNNGLVSDGKYLLGNPKVYDFQKSNELTEGNNKLTELEIFEINFN